MNANKYRNFINGDPILDFLSTQTKYKPDNLLKGFDPDLLLENYTKSNKKILVDKIFNRIGKDAIAIGPDAFVMKTRKLNRHFTNADNFHGNSYSLFTIEYSSISVLKNGAVSSTHKYYNFKNWMYTQECRYQIDNSFLLGRRYSRHGAYNFLANVPYIFDDLLKKANSHLDIVRYKTIGVDIFPNMKNTSDYPWHNAKKLIATEYKELSAVRGISIKDRDEFISRGITSQDGVNLKRSPDFFKNFNKLPLPAVLASSDLLFMDFEILTSVYDDFTTFPESNTKNLLFNVGCCSYEHPDAWSWVATDPSNEEAMLKKFVEFLNNKSGSSVTFVHWTAIEKRIFNEKMSEYPAVGALLIKEIRWFDLHDYCVKSDIYIQDCLNYKLKTVSRCLEQHGLIKSTWKNGSFFDGLGAMTGFIKYLKTKDEKIIEEIVYYNTIDCKVMVEIYDVIEKDLVTNPK